MTLRTSSKAMRLPAILSVFVLLAEPPLALAQVQRTDEVSQQDVDAATLEEAQGLFQGEEIFPPGAGLEGAISGTEYRMGPGDGLLINVWGARPVSYQLTVTLEGQLLIPNIGPVDVDGLLLADAKELIRDRMLEYLRNVEIGITLTQLRQFQIHVLGQVRRPGTYVATAVERVNVAVARAGGLEPGASQRRIRVQSGDSLRTEADLSSFYNSGIVDDNPRLQDGDLIYVPFRQDNVAVRGEVNRGGLFEYLPGDRLSDVLRLTGGFKTTAHLDTLEVARYSESMKDPLRFFLVDGGEMVPLDPADADKLPAAVGTFIPPLTDVPFGVVPSYADFELVPEDYIFVRQDPKTRERSLVRINGEVRYPGTYPIQPGRTRISDVVDAAGGLTPRASLAAAKLTRHAFRTEDKEYERLKKLSRGDMTDEEYAYVKMRARENPGRMVVDFEKALMDRDPKENITLDDGDVIGIPPRADFVTVLGMVKNPGNVAYRPGLRARDYVDFAGGYADGADKGKSRVVKVSTGDAWLEFDEAEPMQAGDVVLVPDKKKHDYFKYFTTGLTITLQALTVYFLVDNIANP